MNKTALKKFSLVGACALILSACSGGGGGGNGEASQPSYKSIDSKNLTTKISKDNYETIAKRATYNIYSQLLNTYGVQNMILGASYEDTSGKFEEDCEQDGTITLNYANFLSGGRAQTGSTANITTQNCVDDDGPVTGSAYTKITNFDTTTLQASYNNISGTGSAKLTGSETSSWVLNQKTTSYKFTLEDGSRLQGDAVFTINTDETKPLPISLTLKENNYQDINGIGSLQFYTATELKFYANGNLKNGKLLAKDNNKGEIHLDIEHGILTINVIVDGKQVVADNKVGDATDYLLPQYK